MLTHRVGDLVVDGLRGLGVDPSALGTGGTSALPDLATLPGPVKLVVESAFGDAIADLFLVAAPVAVISLVAVLFLREVPLSRKSGIEQRLEQDREPEVAAV
ncbi:hypothetical protein [Cellulomonas fimi]|uniref:hypothetical protein n=1 Tax=Cellulomonas fimi TaxID=1708 RepID=UPI0005A27334|nr:hypothetical protein [Cellulomonas fimi]